MNPQQQYHQGYGQSPEHPVTYDQYGNPLYAHPMQHQPVPAPIPAPAAQTQAYPPHEQHHAPEGVQHRVQQKPDYAPEAMRLHEESVKRYPELNLSKGEYVIRSVKRHPIGIIKIWAIAGLLIAALTLFLVGLLASDSTTGSLGISGVDSSPAMLAVPIVLLLSFFVAGGAAIATYVYTSNKFYLTNESIIQEIRETIFARFDQTVTLANIEDISYHQDGILPTILGYGVIRLSTVGDESTYRFTYVTNPRRESAILNNAVEAYKRGLPIEPALVDSGFSSQPAGKVS